MEIIIAKNYQEMSEKAGEIFNQAVEDNPSIVLGLATGSTPEGLYAKMVEAYEEGRTDYSLVHSFNLDEYLNIDLENEQSYHYFMNHHLFSKVNIKKENTHFPSLDQEGSAKHYDQAIEDKGGLDLLVVGMGVNGHIAFIEPSEESMVYTHIANLHPSTIEVNARFFEKREDVPTQAITMGYKSIMGAKKLIVLASGASKKEPVYRLLKGDVISTKWPITLALIHPNCTLICDEESAIKWYEENR